MAEAISREKPGGKEGQGEGCFHNETAQGQAFRRGGQVMPASEGVAQGCAACGMTLRP